MNYENIKQKFINYGKTIITVSGIYIIWIILHYFAAHAYIHWCVPGTFIGFLISPLIVPTPHCQSLRWAIYNGGNNIITMWVLLGVWISNYLKGF